MYKMLRSGKLDGSFQIDKKDSWLYAAYERDLPIFVPGWEDSTLGNIFAAHVINGDIANVHTVRSGIEYMIRLAHWYRRISADASIGFFQIGGGIAGDFPICVVPMLRQDLLMQDIPRVGLLLPDQRFDDELRLVLGRGAEREDHVGQAVGGHAEVHHRIRCEHRRAAGIRERARSIARPARRMT